ncbi:MAG TPA: hypothetical protein VFW00_08785 [Rhodocyclaceae bacterium]|nr:hypothetical protein [Rhodocyclaceae bacterium]
MKSPLANMQEPALRLLALVADEEGLSINKATKKLGLSMSELMRLLATLGNHPQTGGLDLVIHQEEGGRVCLRLTEKGRMLCRAD